MQVQVPNHSILEPAVIGADVFSAVVCITDSILCCGSDENGNGRGDWYGPSGTILNSSSANTDLFYSIWMPIAVTLNYRGNGTDGTTGLYLCRILDSSNTSHNLYLGVYLQNEGI